MECLHTILLGPYKYLFAELMDEMSPVQKNQISARVEAFDFSSFKSQLKSSSICRYYKSFNGKDFKMLAQVCLFIIWDYLTSAQKRVWLALSKVCINKFINVST